MLFTCPADVARGGRRSASQRSRRHPCIAVHCHVHRQSARQHGGGRLPRVRRVLERFPKLEIVVAHGGGYVSHYPARMDHVWDAREDARTALKKRPRQSLAKLYFDTIVFDRDRLKHLVNLWGADHIVVGTDYPYDMGWYDPRGFVDGGAFLKDADKAKILGQNAAKLLKIKGLASMGAPVSAGKAAARRAKR